MYKVCLKCGLPALNVNKATVLEQLKATLIIAEYDEVYICVNPNCEIAYFTQGTTIKINDLKEPLFFKDQSANVSICYCAGLTRAEIKNAVKNGCKTIAQIRAFTGKKKNSNCKVRNPLGECCHNSFLYEIDKALGENPNEFSFKPSSFCK